MFNFGGEPKTLSRDVLAVQIPDGNGIELKSGEQLWLTQRLGGMFTVETEMGYLARIDGKDADALDEEVPPERLRDPKDFEGKSLDEMVWMELQSCYDPEIPANIVDLGLVYSCHVIPLDDGNNRIDVEMTLTAPGCGMGEVLKSDVETRVRELPGVSKIHVEIVFDPPWESSMMTEAARLQLGML
jgi:probable FeS assembly SUF system protein SufT